MKKGKIKVPSTYVLVFGILVLCTILTYIIPAGVFDTIEGSKNIDPNSFHFVENTPIGVWAFLQSIFDGMKKQSSVILFVFIIGGYFQIITDTGAIDSAIGMLVNRFGNKSMFVIPVIMVLMSAFGASGAIANAIVAFIPLGLVLAKKLKLDPVCAVGVIYLACYSGFAISPICPVTLQLAQQIAEIPVLSGTGFRVCVWLVTMTVTIWYVLRYARRVANDPSKSVLEKIEFPFEENEKNTVTKFGARQAAVLIIVAAGFAYYVWGALKFSWDTDKMAAIMLATSVISAIIAGMSAEDISKSFVNGCKSMTFGAIIVGVASAISVVITNGQIIHTIIYGLAKPLAAMPTTIAAVFMFLVNLVFNFFVPSGSGQAAIVMPLMAPMADVLGLTRQVAVCAYQWGDGMSNIIIPTAGTVMACLGIAKVPFEKWVKFLAPLFGIWTLIGCIGMVAAVAVGL